MLPSEGNGFIYQEEESSPLAHETEKYLDNAIAVVEREHYKSEGFLLRELPVMRPMIIPRRSTPPPARNHFRA